MLSVAISIASRDSEYSSRHCFKAGDVVKACDVVGAGDVVEVGDAV